MTKESSVPVKASILLIFTTRLLFLLTLVILSACTNLRTVKIPQEYSSAESKIAIASVEISDINIPSSGWGMLFGAFGYLIEEEITAPKRAALAQNIKEVWGNWRPETVLRGKLAEELTKRGRIVIQEDEIIPLPEKIRAQLSPKMENHEAALLWYNPRITVFNHSTIINRYNPTAIMETGYDNFYIGKDWAVFAMLIKIVDPRTNNVIARKRVVARVTTGKYNLKDPTQLQQFAADFKTGFDNAVAKAVPKMLDDIGL
ncbi:MAG: hypothetical protein FJ110_16995 [Deltaproteobacteria bacterium]|nr:hypothetical protein [Deltaproteobacteria bacterium]